MGIQVGLISRPPCAQLAPPEPILSGVDVMVALEFSKLFVSVRVRDAAPVLSLVELVVMMPLS